MIDIALYTLIAIQSKLVPYVCIIPDESEIHPPWSQPTQKGNYPKHQKENKDNIYNYSTVLITIKNTKQNQNWFGKKTCCFFHN